jgi:hypothetical protein
MGAAGNKILDRFTVAVPKHRQTETFLDYALRHVMPHKPDANESNCLFHCITSFLCN